LNELWQFYRRTRHPRLPIAQRSRQNGSASQKPIVLGDS
jgi:hypothetical protein